MKMAMNAYVISMVCLSGCGLFDSDSSSGTSETVTLAEVGSSGETGTVVLTSTGTSTTQIAITTTGGTDTGVQSAVMYSGTCGTTGTLFAELNNLVSRESITNVAYALSDLEGAKYFIDVNDSTSIDVVDACGGVQ